MHPSGLLAGNEAPSPSLEPGFARPHAVGRENRVTRQNPRGVSRQLILNAIHDLVESQRTITRVAVASMSGLPYPTVDDHLDKLLEEGVVSRVLAGVFDYEPQRQPDRAVSVTLLPDAGRKVKIEVGDVCLDMTVREARMLGELTAGLMLRFGAKY